LAQPSSQPLSPPLSRNAEFDEGLKAACVPMQNSLKQNDVGQNDERKFSSSSFCPQ
jgi:hypothetical protein